MGFFLSAGVYPVEVDLTTTIPAVATSVGVIVLRQTYKGIEHDSFYASIDEDVETQFGKATTSSYKDILSAKGFLKYGNSLYCTRVMPEDATFSGTIATSGYGDNFTEMPTAYDFVSLGTTDLSLFPENTRNSLGSDEFMKFIADSRGGWGDNMKIIIADYDFYNAVKYLDLGTGNLDLPTGITLNSEATVAVEGMFDDYDNNPAVGEPGHDSEIAWSAIRNLDVNILTDKQFVVVVQAKDQGGSTYEDKEIFICSTSETDLDDEGNSMFVETVINEQSKFLRVVMNSSLITDSETDSGRITIGTTRCQPMTKGVNGTWLENEEDSACISAYNLYSNSEEIDVNLFIDSDKGVVVKKDLVNITEVLRKDSFAILDVLRGDVVNNKGFEATSLTKWRKGQDGSTFNVNSSYCSLYGNWLEVFDVTNKKYRWVPSSGYVAGIFANTDNVSDPWFAPAGLNRAILTNVRRLAWNPKQGERDLLYQNGINPIVSFSGQGKVLWGQKTLLDKSSAFNRINVRRLFLVLEKAISKASKYFLFEQNDQISWLLMRNMINPFLEDIKGRRGLYDYLVVVDETNNTPERIDRNEMHGNIFLKPTKTAEFISLKFIATKTGASFSELAQSFT